MPDSRCDRLSVSILCPSALFEIGYWLRGTAVECQSVTGELSFSCARPTAADG